MRLLLTLLTFIALVQAVQVQYYTPAGPKIRIRAVVTDPSTGTSTERYLRFPEGSYLQTTLDETLATAFTYDKDSTNYLFVPSAVSVTRYVVPYYGKESTAA